MNRIDRATALASLLGPVLALALIGCSQSAPVAERAAFRVGLLVEGGEETPAFDTEEYDYIDENPFLDPRRYPLSTFGVDVDTASYSNVRRFIREGRLPPPDAVRVEELVNYFDYDYPDPDGDRPFSVTTEVAGCPWDPAHRIVHIGIQGRRIEERDLPPRNLVFLLDVSGSMRPENKLPLVRKAMRLLVERLGEGDRVAIVVYAGASGLILPPTPCDRKEEILDSIERLEAGGSTNAGEGIRLAYDVARRSFDSAGINRVILATDGDFNVGITNRGDLVRLIEKEREAGVFLTVLGVGSGNLKDSTMETLADRGNGNYAYLDSVSEARKVLVNQAGGTLVAIAKDVKIQVEFNPRKVGAYRLIGYENRLLRAEDFRDDEKDAGEIGAGHTVTALYEIATPAERPEGTGELRYQTPGASTAPALTDEILTLRIRFKEPTGRRSEEIRLAVTDPGAISPQAASGAFRFSAAVAAFGMLLRDSEHRGRADYRMVEGLARDSLGQDPYGYRAEFLRLVAGASDL